MSKDGKEKKSKKGLIIGIIAAVAVLIILFAAIGGGSDDDGSYDSGSSSSGSGSGGNFSSEEDFPLGTAKELDGTIVVMSIAANDATTSWNLDDEADAATLAGISSKYNIGLQWIAEEGKKYGKNINFVFDWDKDPDLFYTADLSADYCSGGSHLEDQKVFIEENLTSYAEKLVSKYNADGIVFLYYLNVPVESDFICFATPFQGTERGMDLPIETMMVGKYVYGQEQGPDTYAHELLHLFGAPDFYSVDDDGSNYGITQEFVDFCNEKYLNDIMVTTYDPFNMTIPLDHVCSDLNEMTAYYIGWLDSSAECESYGVANSAH